MGQKFKETGIPLTYCIRIDTNVVVGLLVREFCCSGTDVSAKVLAMYADTITPSMEPQWLAAGLSQIDYLIRSEEHRVDEIFMDKYLYQYMYLIAYDGTDGFIKLTPEEHARFDGAAHLIIKGCAETGRQAPNCLHLLMIYDKTLDYTFENCGFLKTYRKLFKEAGVLRVKKENYSYTVMKNRSAFLYFNVNGLEAYLKIGESYCEIRNFVPDEMDVQEGKTVLSHTARGWYYLPWKEKQNTSDWWQMDHKKRDLMITSDLHTQVVITELADGLEISVDTDGLERLPLRMELCVPSETTLENDHFCMETVAGKSMVLSDDYVTMTKGLTSIEFGPGACEHHFKGHYSGEEVNADGYTIYCNTYTPTKRVYTLKVK